MDYSTYRQHIEKLSYKKFLLKKNLSKLKRVRNNYLDYLKKNPYKDKKRELEKYIKNLRKELIAMIPDYER